MGFHGMVQLVVSDFADMDMLLALLPIGHANNMSKGQQAHHVTLAFRPEDNLKLELCEQFKDGAVFLATNLRSNGQICAVFGDLIVDGVVVSDKHITLGGTVSPVKSNDLTPEHIVQVVVMRIPLHLNVVEFTAP